MRTGPQAPQPTPGETASLPQWVCNSQPAAPGGARRGRVTECPEHVPRVHLYTLFQGTGHATEQLGK